MNGVGEEEARWQGHFLHHRPAPVFPGSLAIAGAEIAPPPEFSPEEQASLAALRVRREAALRATAEREEAERRAAARARGEAGEEEEPAGDEPTDGGGSDVKESGPQVLSAVEGHPRAGFENRANLPESQHVANATILPETRDAGRNGRRDADSPHGEPYSAGDALSEAAEAARRRAETDAYIDKVLADSRARIPEAAAVKAAAEGNGANIPESPAGRSAGRVSEAFPRRAGRWRARRGRRRRQRSGGASTG